MGSGFKDFAAGDILTAADVDGYLMRQTVMTFADASARDSALSGVLDEGMVAYLEDTNVTTYYDGSAWQNLTGLVSGTATEVPGTFTTGDLLKASEVNALPGGLVLAADRTSDFTSIGTSFTDIVSGSFTAVSGRNYLVHSFCFFYSPSTAAQIEGKILWDATSLQLTAVHGSTTVNVGNLAMVRAYTAPSSGSVTVKLQVRATAGTVNLAGGAGAPITVIVQDVGDVI